MKGKRPGGRKKIEREKKNKVGRSKENLQIL
jgi:hypothetical protein